MRSFKLTVISTDGVIFKGECTSLIIPCTDGLSGIQAGFENAFFELTEGEIQIKNPKEIKKIKASSGIAMCENGEVTITLN